MPQTYTGSVGMVVKAVDNTSGQTAFNVNVPSLIDATCTIASFQTFAGVATVLALVGSVPVAGIYIRNLSSSAGNLSISWNNGSTTVVPVVLPAGACIMVFNPGGSVGISSVSITPASTADIEAAIWK